MVTMILGVAFPVAILGLLDLLRRNYFIGESNRLRALVGISLLNMMAVSAIFEAWQYLFTWMHTRYYSYLIPLAVVVLIEAYSRGNGNSKPIMKRIVVGTFSVLASIALFTAAIPYGANWIDAPDFRFHIDNLVMSSILIVISIALAIWWLWDVKKSMLVAVIVALVASTFSGAHISNFLVANFGKDSVHDQLGRVLRNYLPQEELDKTVLIGDNNATMERALFSSLSGAATPILAPEDGFELADIPPGTRWVIKVGDPKIIGLGEPIISGPGYSFYPQDSGNSFTPRVTGEFSLTESCASGDSPDWACGSVVEIILGEIASAGAQIDVLIEVSETASDFDLEFILGDSGLTASLPPGIFSVNLGFTNSSPSNTLVIQSPTRAQESGLLDEKFVRVVSVIEKR
jgi:hypothetical protein